MATQYSNKPIVTDGLVYALDFGNPKSYVSGSTIANSLKYETNLTFVTGSTSIPNSVSPVLFFTGSQWIERTGSFSVFNPNGAFTLSIVVNARTAGTLVSQTSSLGNLVSNVSPTSSTFGFANPNYTRGIQGLSPTQLNHLTYRYSSGTLDIFYNGTLITASQATISLPASSVVDEFYINGNNGLLNNFSGSLAAISVYNRSLTINEIQSNYILSKNRYGLTQEQNYTLDENAFVFLQSAGITDPIITGSIDTFVRGLKQNNLWDKMIAIYPFVGTGSAGVNLTGSHRWNLKEPSLVTYPLSFTGSWIGSTSGSAPSGSNTNISTQVAPSTYYPFYNTQSAHISILSYDTPVSSSYLMGTGMTEDLAISTLAGDYGTPAATYSVRKVRTAYTGALMDVRRNYDNVTQSIGFVSNGDLDTGSLLDWTIPGRSILPGAYSGLAAAYSLRRVSGSYTGSAIQANNGLAYRDIGFDTSGNLNTGSLTSLVATGSNVSINSYSGLAAAYSIRKVVPGYAGPAIEVQSGSISQSIGFNSIGNLDTVSLQSFAGSGNAFVKTWYDQSGNNNHATQAVSTSQPQIVSGGSVVLENGKPNIMFDGIADFLKTTNSVINTDFSIFSVAKTPSSGDNRNGFLVSQYAVNDGNRFYVFIDRAVDNNTLGLQVGDDFDARTGTPTFIQKVYYWNRTGSNVEFSTNSTSVTTGTNNITAQNSGLGFGGFEAGQRSLINMQEVLIYTSSQAATRTRIENNINAYYDIYTTSSTSTENAFVSTWYDQSGNNRHATQTTASSQPLIVSSGSLVTENGKPAMRFDGVNDSLTMAGLNSYPVLDQYFVTSTSDTNYGYPNENPFTKHGFVATSGAPDLDITNQYGAPSLYANGTLFTGNTRGQIYTFLTGSKVVVHQGANISLWSQYNFGNLSSYQYSGSLQELIAYTSSQAANRPLIENNINNYYNIYTGSNHGFVARWYDQSGNNRHATQTATGSQPVIVLSGSIINTNSRPSLKFDGVNDSLGINYNASAGTIAVQSVQKINSASGMSILIQESGPHLYLQWVNTPSTFANYYNGQYGETPFSTNQILHSFYMQTGGGGFFQNGISTITRTQGGSGASSVPMRIGAYAEGILHADSNHQEFIVYQTAQSSNRGPIEYNINNYYNIYPQTSSFATSSFTIQATPTAISGAINNRLTSGIPSSGPLGLITVSRTGSNSLIIARNGVTSSFAVPASGALSTGIFLGAINNNGLALGNSPLNISFASVGTGLTGAETSTLSNLVGTLNLDLGRAKLLDAYAGAAAAYSLRQLSNSYTGSAIEVRRSNDNASASIGFTPEGDLDVAALQTFVGSNSAFVKTWYDQSGNGRHGIQTDNTLQPHIVTSGQIIYKNNRPALNFPDRTDWLDTTSFPIDSSKGMFFLYIDDPIAYVGSKVYTFGGYSAGGLNILDNQFRVNGTVLGSFAAEAANIAYRVKSYYTTGNTAFVSFNSQIITTQTFTPFTIPNPVSLASIGRSTVGGSEALYGTLQEMILYNVDKSEVKSNIEENVNNYYQIY